MTIPTEQEQKEMIGLYTPHKMNYPAYPFYKKYHGNDPDLKDKWALVGFTFVGGATVAQFDDVETGRGYGWWPMKHSDFWKN